MINGQTIKDIDGTNFSASHNRFSWMKATVLTKKFTKHGRQEKPKNGQEGKLKWARNIS